VKRKCSKTSISFATAQASQMQDKARKKDRTVQKRNKEKRREKPLFKQKKEEKSEASTNDI
jgi:hypothetical protein